MTRPFDTCSDQLTPWLVCAVLAWVLTTVASAAWFGRWRPGRWHDAELTRLRLALIRSRWGANAAAWAQAGDYETIEHAAERVLREMEE